VQVIVIKKMNYSFLETLSGSLVGPCGSKRAKHGEMLKLIGSRSRVTTIGVLLNWDDNNTVVVLFSGGVSLWE
jgi:hypothetical protein